MVRGYLVIALGLLISLSSIYDSNTPPPLKPPLEVGRGTPAVCITTAVRGLQGNTKLKVILDLVGSAKVELGNGVAKVATIE
jgi:hypothetical protein